MRLRSALERPSRVLVALVLLQWVATASLAVSTRHNGWVWFQGGDQIWYVTSGWLLGGLDLPHATISGGWPMLLAPLTWLTGPTFVQALPLVLLVDVLVLAPLAVLAVYGIGSEIAGRYFGYWCAVLWVATPFAAIPLFVDRYHGRFVEQFLPQALGLTAMPDFPSMVMLLGAGYFVVRNLREGGLPLAVLGGLLAGYAGWTKPPNLLFLAGAALAYLVARRWREAVAFGVAILPALLTLTLWKYRGLGSLPVFALAEVHQAAGGVLATPLDRYLKLDWDHWGGQMAQLREYFWSARLAQWAPFAGAIALFRVRPAAAAVLVGWLAAFLLVKGTSPLASIETGTFFRLLMPAWPAYLLLLAAIPLLVPGAARRLARSAEPPGGAGVVSRRTLAVAVAALAVAPLLIVVIASPVKGPERAVIQSSFETSVLLTPVLPELAATVEPVGESRVIRWEHSSWRSDVFYRVYRTQFPGVDDVECDTTGAARCLLRMVVLTTTRGRSFVDGSPPPGVSYRVGVATNWRNEASLGDVFAIGPPLFLAR